MEQLLKMKYQELVDFLIEKYGKVPGSYFLTDTYKSANPKIKRGKEGLFVHHIDEDKAVMLSTVDVIKSQNYPWEWQQGDRLVYCDLLEHLLLHIKIMEEPHPDKWENHKVGFGGAFAFMIPELNDIYSGIEYKQPWKQAVVKKVINRKEEYFKLLKAAMPFCEGHFENIYSSLPANSMIWNIKKNEKLFDEIETKVVDVFFEENGIE